ncbi:hypothetical protein FQN52_007062 [Onygenales sp. PD_12]|nr:hypothetical protein FQN52_007062 [Onygenales sp. PD_12]
MAPPYELEEGDMVMDEPTSAEDSSNSDGSFIAPEDRVKEERLLDPVNVDYKAKTSDEGFHQVTLDNGKAVLMDIWHEGMEPSYENAWPRLDPTPEEQYNVKVGEKTITISGSIDIQEAETKLEDRQIIPDDGEYPELQGCFECYKKDDEGIDGMDVYSFDGESPREVDITQTNGDENSEENSDENSEENSEENGEENGEENDKKWKVCTFTHTLCFDEPGTYLVRFFGKADLGDKTPHYTGRRTVGPIIVGNRE